VVSFSNSARVIPPDVAVTEAEAIGGKAGALLAFMSSFSAIGVKDPADRQTDKTKANEYKRRNKLRN